MQGGDTIRTDAPAALGGMGGGSFNVVDAGDDEVPVYEVGLQCLWRSNAAYLKAVFWSEEQTWLVDMLEGHCVGIEGTVKEEACLLGEGEIQETKYITGNNLVRRHDRAVSIISDDETITVNLPNITEATRFYECCKIALSDELVWAPLLALPEPNPAVLMAKLSGFFKEAPLRRSSKKIDLSGECNITTSRDPTAMQSLWVGNLDLNYSVLPVRADLSRWLPRGKDLYVIGLLGISDALYEERMRLTNQIWRHVGKRGYHNLMTVDNMELTVMVLARHSVSKRVHSLKTMKHCETRPSQEEEDAVSPLVCVQLNFDETLMCFACTKVLLLKSDLGWEAAGIRSRVLTSIMSAIDLEGRPGCAFDPSSRFDHFFVFGGLGDEIFVEVQKGNALQGFIEGDLVLPKGGSLSQRIFYSSLPCFDLTPETYDASVPWGTIEEGRHAVGAFFDLPVQLPYIEALSTPSALHSFEVSAQLKLEEIDSSVPLNNVACTLCTECASKEDNQHVVESMTIGTNALPTCTFEPIQLHTNSQAYLSQQCLYITASIEGHSLGSGAIAIHDIFKSMWSGTGVEYVQVSDSVKKTTPVPLTVALHSDCKASGATVLCNVSVFTDAAPLIHASEEKQERDEVTRQEMIGYTHSSRDEILQEQASAFDEFLELKRFIDSEKEARCYLQQFEALGREHYKIHLSTVNEEVAAYGGIEEYIEYFVVLDQITQTISGKMTEEAEELMTVCEEEEEVTWGILLRHHQWELGMHAERVSQVCEETEARANIDIELEEDVALLLGLKQLSHNEVLARHFIAEQLATEYMQLEVVFSEATARDQVVARYYEVFVAMFEYEALAVVQFTRSHEALYYQALQQRSWLGVTETTERLHTVILPSQISALEVEEVMARESSTQQEAIEHNHTAGAMHISGKEHLVYCNTFDDLRVSIEAVFESAFRQLVLNEGVHREDMLVEHHDEVGLHAVLHEELSRRYSMVQEEVSLFTNMEDDAVTDRHYATEACKLRIDKEVSQQRHLSEREEEERQALIMLQDTDLSRVASLFRYNLQVVTDNLLHDIDIAMRRAVMEETYLRERVMDEEEQESTSLAFCLSLQNTEVVMRLGLMEECDVLLLTCLEDFETLARSITDMGIQKLCKLRDDWMLATIEVEREAEYQRECVVELEVLENIGRRNVAFERFKEAQKLLSIDEDVKRMLLKQQETMHFFHLNEHYCRSVLTELCAEQWCELTDSLRFPQYPKWDETLACHNITRQGQVQIKIKEGRRAQFEHRWLVMRNTSLSIYEEKMRLDLSFGVAAGSMPLNPCGFSLSTLGTVGSDALVFNTPSSGERDSWVSCLLGYENGKLSTGTQTERDTTDYEKIKEEAMMVADEKYSKMVTAVVGKLEDNMSHMQTSQRQTEEAIINTIHRRERDVHGGRLRNQQEETDMKINMLEGQMERLRLEKSPPQLSLQARIMQLESDLQEANMRAQAARSTGPTALLEEELHSKSRIIASLEEQLAQSSLASPLSLPVYPSGLDNELLQNRQLIIALEEQVCSLQSQLETSRPSDADKRLQKLHAQLSTDDETQVLKKRVVSLEEELAASNSQKKNSDLWKAQQEASAARGEVLRLKDALKIAMKHEGVPYQVKEMLSSPGSRAVLRTKGVQTVMTQFDVSNLEETIDYAATLDERFSTSVERVKGVIPYNAYCMLTSALSDGDTDVDPILPIDSSPSSPSYRKDVSVVSFSPEARLQGTDINLLAEAVQAARQEQQETVDSVQRLFRDMESMMRMYQPTPLTEAIRRSIGVFNASVEGNVQLPSSPVFIPPTFVSPERRSMTSPQPVPQRSRSCQVDLHDVRLELSDVREQNALLLDRVRETEAVIRKQADDIRRHQASEKELLELTTELSDEIELIESRARAQEQTYQDIVTVHEEQGEEYKHRILELELRLQSGYSSPRVQSPRGQSPRGDHAVLEHFRRVVEEQDVQNRNLRQQLHHAEARASDTGSESRLMKVVGEQDMQINVLREMLKKEQQKAAEKDSVLTAPSSPLSQRLADQIFESNKDKLLRAVDDRGISQTMDTMVGNMLAKERLVNTVGGVGELKEVEVGEGTGRKVVEREAQEVLIIMFSWMVSEGRLRKEGEGPRHVLEEDAVERKVMEMVRSPARERQKMFEMLEGVSSKLGQGGFLRGDLVRIAGLTSASYLNGKTGVIVNPPTPATDRYLVSLAPPFGDWALRRSSLTPVPLTSPTFTESTTLQEVRSRLCVSTYEACLRACLVIYSQISGMFLQQAPEWPLLLDLLERCQTCVKEIC